jgi:hypothetical protein
MKRSRHHALEPLGLVLQRDTALRVPASVETSPIAARDWEAAVGSRIAARARPVRIDHGVLVVRTATSTWAQELGFLVEPILAQLRARGVKVDALRFRVGPVEAPERPPTRDEVRTSPPAVPLPAELRAEVDRVEDPELRDAIARAAAKNLGWQATRDPRPEKPRVPRKPVRARADGVATPPVTEVRATSTPPGAASAPATSAPSGARAPRSAGTGSAPPDQRPRTSPAGSRGKPGSR